MDSNTSHPQSSSVGDSLAREQRHTIVERLLAERQATPRAAPRTVTDAAVTPSSADRVHRLFKAYQSQLHGQTAPGACSPAVSCTTADLEARFLVPGAYTPITPAQAGQGSRADSLSGTPLRAFELIELLSKEASGPVEISQALLWTPMSTTASKSGDSTSAVASIVELDAGSPLPSTFEGRGGCAGERVAFSPGHAAEPIGRGESDSGSQRPSSNAHRRSNSRQKLHFERKEDVVEAAATKKHTQRKKKKKIPARSISAPRARPTSSAVTPREFKMSAPRHRHSRQAVIEAAEEQASRELTFSPQLHRPKSAGPACQPQSEKDRRLQKLAQPRVAHWQKCAERKAEADQQDLKECSFAPKTRSLPADSRIVSGGGCVVNRLYEKKDAKLAQLEAARQELEARKLDGCTFAPQINKNDKLLRSYTPLHERLSDLQRRRSERLLRSQGGGQEHSFTPTINAASSRIVMAKELRELQDDSSVRDSFQSSGSRRLRTDRQASTGGLEEECTFAPKINPTSERLLEDSRAVPSDFFARQRFFHELRQEKLRQLQLSTEDKHCIFRPEISPGAESILAWAPDGQMQLDESFLEKVERLSSHDAQRQHKARKEQEQRYYRQFTFQPTINARSQRLAARPLSELANNAPSLRARQAALRADEEKRKQCTFQPDLSKAAVRDRNHQPVIPSAAFTLHGQNPSSLVRRVEAYEKQRQAKLEQHRKTRENSELTDCTFTPQLCKSPKLPKGQVQVKGLDRFLEKTEAAKRQKEERAAREAKVFNFNPKAPSQAPTLQKPFKLSQPLPEEAEARRACLEEARMAEVMRECTFRPLTNEMQSKELIRLMLASDDDSTSFEQEPSAREMSVCELLLAYEESE